MLRSKKKMPQLVTWIISLGYKMHVTMCMLMQPSWVSLMFVQVINIDSRSHKYRDKDEWMYIVVTHIKFANLNSNKCLTSHFSFQQRLTILLCSRSLTNTSFINSLFVTSILDLKYIMQLSISSAYKAFFPFKSITSMNA